MLDPLTAFDWAAHWSRLVEERERQGSRRAPDFWDRRSRNYAYSVRSQPDPLPGVLEPFFGPHKTLIDVGAGSGRHATPLADRLEWVTAVEPSEGMRQQIEPRPNMTVVATAWEDAEVAPADLVLSAHVLYTVSDPVPFIQKMEASARERVFLYLRDGELRVPVELLWEEFTGTPRARLPRFYDAYNLLRWMGVHPDVVNVQVEVGQRYRDLEDAVEDCRLRLDEAWDEERGRAWLEANLKDDEAGGLLYDGGTITSGIAHWQPRG
jgi:SAM-dependent methyltransferase